MDIKLVLSIVATILAMYGFIPYFRDLFAGKTKPHIYTWLIWSITQGTAVVGLIYGDGGWGTLSIAVTTFFVFFVFLLSFKYGTKNITRSDTVALLVALLAILVWWKLDQPLISIAMISAIDFIGYIPSFRKTFENPWSETVQSWMIFVVSNLLSIAALSQYNFLTVTYLATITTANLTLSLICLFQRRRKRSTITS